MGDNEIPQESWNMATATLQRLDRLLNQCSLSAQSGNLFGWFNTLMDLRRNLFPFMDKENFGIVENKLKSIPKGWALGGRVSPTNYAIVNQCFDEVFMIFIQTMKDKGLLMPKTIDTRKSVLEM